MPTQQQITTSGVGAAVTGIVVGFSSGAALGIALGALVFSMLLIVQLQQELPVAASPSSPSKPKPGKGTKPKKPVPVEKKPAPVEKKPEPQPEEDSESESELEAKKAKKKKNKKKKGPEPEPEPVPEPEPKKKKKKKSSSGGAPAPTPAPAPAPAPAASSKKGKKKEPDAPKAEAPKAQAPEAAAKKTAPLSKKQPVKEEPKEEMSKSQLKRLKAKEREAKKKAASKPAAASSDEETEPVEEQEQEVEDGGGWTLQEDSYLTKKRKQAQAAGAEMKRRKAAGELPAAEEVKTVCQLVIKVPSKNHPQLIGQGGKTLQSIQSISNGEPVALGVAKRIITDLITKGFSMDMAREEYGPDTVCEEVVVKASDVGRIIGPARSTLGLIEEYSGVQETRIPEKSGRDPTSPSAPPIKITFIGSAAAVAKAKTVVEELLTEGYSRVTHSNWARLEMQVPPEDLTLIIGKGGATIKAIQNIAKECKIVVPERKSGSDKVIVVGPEDELRKVEAEIRKALEPKPVEPVEEEDPNEFDEDGHNPWQMVEESSLAHVQRPFNAAYVIVFVLARLSSVRGNFIEFILCLLRVCCPTVVANNFVASEAE
eukprot:g35.t1